MVRSGDVVVGALWAVEWFRLLVAAGRFAGSPTTPRSIFRGGARWVFTPQLLVSLSLSLGELLHFAALLSRGKGSWLKWGRRIESALCPGAAESLVKKMRARLETLLCSIL